MTQYKPVQVKIDDNEKYEDVHLDVLGMHLDLPNLNSADLPIELVQMILIIKSKPVLSDEETAQFTSVFLAYFQRMQPNFWNRLSKTDHALEWLSGTVQAWATESGLDPKALS